MDEPGRPSESQARSDRRVRSAYEPPLVWEALADVYEGTLSRPRPDVTEDVINWFEPADGGLVQIRWGFSLEQAARVAATSSILGLAPALILDRAVATQWYLDKNLSAGLHIVLHGDGRFRREVRLPVTPTRMA